MKRASVVWALCFAVIIFVIASLGTVPAYAGPVTYAFSGSRPDIGLTFSFVYTAPDFVTSMQWISASVLDAWSISNGYIIQIQFLPAGTFYPTADVINVNYGTQSFIYFDQGSFSTPGTHVNSGFSYNTGNLTVTTPEPSEFLLLGIGFAAVCLVGWQFRS